MAPWLACPLHVNHLGVLLVSLLCLVSLVQEVGLHVDLVHCYPHGPMLTLASQFLIVFFLSGIWGACIAFTNPSVDTVAWLSASAVLIPHWLHSLAHGERIPISYGYLPCLKELPS